MISLIAQQGAGPYLTAMASALFKLMALVAVLLMPAGLAGAPALAQSASASAEHCDEHQQPADIPEKPQAHCTACAALPALGAPEAVPELRPQAPRVLASSQPFSDVEPETATPPPRFS